jgi:hypothetical protein
MTDQVAVREYVYVCSKQTARDVRDAAFGQLRAGFLSLFGGLIVVGVLLWASGDRSLGLPMLGGAVVGVCGTLHTMSARRWAGTLGPGVELRTSFGADSMTMTGPLSSSTVPYTSFTDVRVRGRMTMWKLRGAKMRCVLPVEIFPSDEIARVKAASATA